MKTLYIIRHGKSDWNQGVRDYERPLNARGKQDAPQMGRHLLAHFNLPDYVMSSSANRAISTARLLLSEMSFDLNRIDEKNNLYHASVPDTLWEINQIPDDISTVYLFGHNPGLSDLVTYLSSEPLDLKTCCVAILEIQVDSWRELSRETGILKAYISPRQI